MLSFFKTTFADRSLPLTPELFSQAIPKLIAWAPLLPEVPPLSSVKKVPLSNVNLQSPYKFGIKSLPVVAVWWSVPPLTMLRSQSPLKSALAPYSTIAPLPIVYLPGVALPRLSVMATVPFSIILSLYSPNPAAFMLRVSPFRSTTSSALTVAVAQNAIAAAKRKRIALPRE